MKNPLEDLILAYLNEEVSADEVEQLFKWVRESPENAEDFARACSLHGQLREQIHGAREASDVSVAERTSSSVLARKSRHNWKSVAFVSAACLLIAVGLGTWWMSSGGTPQNDLIVVSPVVPGNSSETMLPFTLEAAADVVAIAVMGKPQSRRGQQVIGMELVEVLKGQQQIGPLESADGIVPFGCIMPQDPKQFSDMYSEGERVAVYLKKNNNAWATLQMNHLTAEYEPQWKTRVHPFLDVLLASETDDPKQRYTELLVASADEGKPQLTETSYFALRFNPDRRAADAVHEILLASLEQDHVKRLQGGLNPKKQTTKEQAVTVFPNKPIDLVMLLAKMHDAESIQPVLVHIARLSEDQRDPFIQQLPELCRNADARTLRTVHSILDKYIAEHQGSEDDAYYRNLIRVQALIVDLLEG